jgi:hypothetical protein
MKDKQLPPPPSLLAWMSRFWGAILAAGMDYSENQEDACLLPDCRDRVAVGFYLGNRDLGGLALWSVPPWGGPVQVSLEPADTAQFLDRGWLVLGEWDFPGAAVGQWRVRSQGKILITWCQLLLPPSTDRAMVDLIDERRISQFHAQHAVNGGRQVHRDYASHPGQPAREATGTGDQSTILGHSDLID